MTDQRPHILLVFTDQQRFDTIQALGSSFQAATPAMDDLVARGTSFTQCCCTAPICSPSRSSLMTGLHPAAAGMADNLYAPCPPLSRSLPTIGDQMQAAGYETVYHGKWHLGGNILDYGFESGQECSFDEETRRMACRYWRDRDWVAYQRPFFHVVSFLDPHDLYFYDPEDAANHGDYVRPWKNTGKRTGPVPESVANRQVDWDESHWGACVRFYEQRIEKVDTDIRMLLEELRCSGFASNTWIIFCSDHGDMCGEQNLAFKGPYMYEGVVRVPLVIVPPQRRFVGQDRIGAFEHDLKPSRHDVQCSLLDVPATILDLAGAEIPENWDGVSLLPWVTGDRDDDPHEVVFSAWGTPRVNMARSRDWKYILHADGAEELFRLSDDPAETENRAEDAGCQSVLTTYRELIQEQIKRTVPFGSGGLPRQFRSG